MPWSHHWLSAWLSAWLWVSKLHSEVAWDFWHAMMLLPWNAHFNFLQVSLDFWSFASVDSIPTCLLKRTKQNPNPLTARQCKTWCLSPFGCPSVVIQLLDVPNKIQPGARANHCATGTWKSETTCLERRVASLPLDGHLRDFKSFEKW